MKQIIDIIKEYVDHLVGWVQIALHKESGYKCFIDSIELRGKNAIIHYKTIGCRSLQQETAVNLNKSAVFSLFRADHAQMIVSIATVESILGKSATEIQEKFQKYVSYCSFKINKRT